ncbi:hydrogen gas-evolving membrane-bound hydrogenase subunit E [Fusibacter sp. 3D3]|uniref:hydrogen gas-evolving membrane-bound hydrogenase subunit E n=1 Tax=Fusibacter sp. 3D3 TaxID=1048380 RepID=UPI0008532740|nr:hydrogen gas-evolving membrane-bound hydrogenase subunit E [Fusibacter sp. 3D3]GAU77932.1 hypothetical protein F3D3_2561 [Fusibacter sp. 3D3]
MRRKGIALLCLTGFIMMALLTATSDQVPYDISNHYIQNAYRDTGATNIVTSIYLSYRYYDTLFEALMLLFSIIGVVYLSIHEGDELDE